MNSYDEEAFMDPDMSDPLKPLNTQDEMDLSMQFAYSMIEEVGIENWVNILPIESRRKLTILNNMIRWYQEREEYERCAYLLKGTHLIDK